YGHPGGHRGGPQGVSVLSVEWWGLVSVFGSVFTCIPADIYEALTSVRTYWKPQEAGGSGGQLNREAVRSLGAVL
ncbi:MAG: hypothetical protein ACUVS9_02310, partial [Thermaceae bacterium]